MTDRVVVLARARHGVQEKYDWVASRAPEGAERWLDRFEQALETLQSHPFMAPLAPESKSFDIEIRHVLFRTPYGRPDRAFYCG
jgi:plasmid stabilization system protein ParE